MAFDFTYENFTINSSGGFIPTKKNAPTNPREVVDTYADIANIPNPYVGLTVTVKADETNSNKMTDYKVISLKANALGVPDMLVDKVQRLSDYIGRTVGGGTADLSNYQTITDETLKTTEKTIPGAINELKTFIDSNISNSFTFIETELRTKRFNGLKVLVDGDSITEANFRCDRNWHDYLSDWLGFRSVVNKAVSGTGFISSDNGVLSRITTYPTDVDLILLMGCMNDLHYVREGKLGTFEDSNNTTVYGGLHQMFTTLLEKFPKTPIMVITSQPRAAVEDNESYMGEKRWGKNTPACQINEALKEVCEHYAIPCLDLYSSSYIKPWITSNRNRLCPDGVHPNTEGQYVMAEQILPFVRQAWIPTDEFLNANVPLTGISLSQNSLTLGEGEQFTLSVIPSPTNASNANVRWSSNNTSVATVEEAVVRAVAVGNAVITATSIEGGYTATCNVTVSAEGGTSIVADGLVTYVDALDNTENSTTWTSRNSGLDVTLSNIGTSVSGYDTATKSMKLNSTGTGVITGSGQTGAFTMEALLTIKAYNQNATIIPFSNYNPEEISNGVGFIIRSSTVEISDRTGSSTNVIASTDKDGSITTNYVLVSITVDSDKTTKLYLNGELKGSGVCSGFSTNDFILHHQLLKSNTSSNAIASFRLYNRALSKTEIQNNLTCEQLLRTF